MDGRGEEEGGAEVGIGSACAYVIAFRAGSRDCCLAISCCTPCLAKAIILASCCVVEDLMFGCGLHFDHLLAGGHDEVHVDVGAGVFFVGEVEQDFSVDNSHADCRDKILERN